MVMIVPAFFHQKQATSAMLQLANGVFRWFLGDGHGSHHQSLWFSQTNPTGEQSPYKKWLTK